MRDCPARAGRGTTRAVTHDPRALLRERYGFDFPESFFSFHAWLRAHAIDLHDVLEISLADPFRAFDTGLDGDAFDPVGSARYYNDPPEFFTVLLGHTDGLHWGYWIDDAPARELPVVGYYHSDAFELTVAGSDLFDLVARQIDQGIEGERENIQYDEGERAFYEERITKMETLRDLLPPRSVSTPKRAPIAPTRERMGIVVPPERYRALPDDPFGGWDYRPGADEVARMEARALELLAEGFPGAALKLGRDLWIYREHAETSVRLLDAAYEALDRPLQRAMLRFRKPRDAGDERAFQRALAAPDDTAHLFLAGKNIETLPASVGALSGLRNLTLFNNRLSSLPDELAHTRIEVLQLDTNRFESIPPVLARVPTLRQLHFASNPVAEVPPSLSFPALEELHLSGLRRFPAGLARSPRLARLHLRALELESLESDAFPALEELTLELNRPLEDVRGSLGDSPRLRKLCLRVRSPEERPYLLPDELLRFPALEELEIQSYGELAIPDELHLPALRRLRLELHGLDAVPSAVASLTSLRSLALAYLQIDALPEELRALEALEHLDVYGTQIRTFPAWLAKLPNLQSIRHSATYVSADEKLRIQAIMPEIELKF